MTDFEENKYIVVERFLDTPALDTISQYFSNSLKRFPQNIHDHNNKYDNSSNRISWRNDPLIEVLHINSLPDVESVTGLSLYPTYTFTRIYKKGDVLRPHVDRSPCEITVTCNITTQGEIWPLCMKSPGKEPMLHYLEPGSACIYKGCEVTHWRDEAHDTTEILQIMLHYVDKNGPYAHHKFDNK
jgi:hypothetical protein